MRRKRKPRELFLSHSSRDRAFVRRLAKELRRHGIHCWFSEHQLKGADQWHDQIGRALRRCDWFAVVLSKDAVASMWVKREVLFALKQPRFRDRIIPVIHKRCSYARLSWALDDSQMVDFSKRFAAGFETLLNIWGNV